jgi:hypothetical protein
MVFLSPLVLKSFVVKLGGFQSWHLLLLSAKEITVLRRGPELSLSLPRMRTKALVNFFWVCYYPMVLKTDGFLSDRFSTRHSWSVYPVVPIVSCIYRHSNPCKQRNLNRSSQPPPLALFTSFFSKVCMLDPTWIGRLRVNRIEFLCMRNSHIIVGMNFLKLRFNSAKMHQV